MFLKSDYSWQSSSFLQVILFLLLHSLRSGGGLFLGTQAGGAVSGTFGQVSLVSRDGQWSQDAQRAVSLSLLPGLSAHLVAEVQRDGRQPLSGPFHCVTT